MEIAGTALSLASAAATISLSIARLVRDVRDLKGDLATVQSELDSIEGILFTIADHMHTTARNGNVVSRPLTNRLNGVIDHCQEAIQDTSQLITKYSGGGFRATAGWLARGKAEVGKMQERLHVRRQDLEIVLSMLSV
jgi:hypothetical protein